MSPDRTAAAVTAPGDESDASDGRGAGPGAGIGEVGAATVRRLEQASAGMATQAVALMDERLPWFRDLPARLRAGVLLVAQAGISGYVDWLTHPSPARLTGAIFGPAPRELLRSVSFRRTVELVRVAIEVAEQQFPALAADAAERAILTESLIRYSREVAFSAATVYATAAESRGAWDQRLEAFVVDAVVRGEAGDSVESRAAALNWDTGRPAAVLLGSPGPADADRSEALILPATTLTGRHGDRLIVIVADTTPAAVRAAARKLLPWFGPGPVVLGPVGVGVTGAIASAGHGLAALRAVAARPGAERGVDADALLPERVLDGDPLARAILRAEVYDRLRTTDPALLTTADAYFTAGRSLQGTARALFVHVNTVRYRLRRIADLTGLAPEDPRDGWTLQVAMAVGRLGGTGDRLRFATPDPSTLQRPL